MARKEVWFGTAESMSWIPAPSVNMGLGSTAWRTVGNYINGGAVQRQSTAASRAYSMSWAAHSQADIYPVLAYLEGNYGAGPLFFCDPFAMTTNALPQWLAAPYMMAQEAPNFGGTRPYVLSNTGPSTANYPSRSLQLEVVTTTTYKSFRVPVPPGYTLHIGAHGNRTGTAAVRVVNAISGVGSNLTMMDTITSTRTNASFTGGAHYLVTVAGAGVLTLTGLIAQILPDGETPEIGPWLPGRGNSGLRLSGDPMVTGYSAAITHASVGLSAEFVETGAWE